MLAENAKFIVYYGFISALKLGDDLIWYGTFCIIIYIVRGQLEVYNTYSCKLCQLENYKISSLSSFIILLYSVHFHSLYYYTQSTFIHYIIILSPISFIILLYSVHFHSSYYYTQSTFIHHIIILSPLSFIILLYSVHFHSSYYYTESTFIHYIIVYKDIKIHPVYKYIKIHPVYKCIKIHPV